MSKFKAMKIRTTTEQHVKEVQEALYRLGYAWHTQSPDKGHYKFVDDCYALMTYKESGCIVRVTNEGGEDDFDVQTDFEEHWLSWGNIVNKDYFTQPKSIVPPATNAELVKSSFATALPVLGLKPRRVHDQARLVEIAEAIVRYAQAGKKVDSQWIVELSYLNEIVGE